MITVITVNLSTQFHSKSEFNSNALHTPLHPLHLRAVNANAQKEHTFVDCTLLFCLLHRHRRQLLWFDFPWALILNITQTPIPWVKSNPVINRRALYSRGHRRTHSSRAESRSGAFEPQALHRRSLETCAHPRRRREREEPPQEHLLKPTLRYMSPLL